ncbi:MAG: 23S rRNA (adenine(2503)-C(2))-methyltransferase RlmN, partial [Acidimicrobiales bacterium]
MTAPFPCSTYPRGIPFPRFDLSLDDLAALMPGEPAYRARQVWHGLHQGREPGEMTELPRALRERLAAELPPSLELRDRSVSEGGDTVKWAYGLRGPNAAVETVLMKYRDRTTVCISSQAGCAMACTFCATGQAGFTRHLTAGEIVEQVVRAKTADPTVRNLL